MEDELKRQVARVRTAHLMTLSAKVAARRVPEEAEEKASMRARADDWDDEHRHALGELEAWVRAHLVERMG